MTDIQKAYYAGFFGGEGTVSIEVYKRKGKCTDLLALYVVNTDRRILEQLKTNFGGHIQKHSKSVLSVKTCWKWKITDRAGFNFLLVIHPYLVVKKLQADIAIEYVNKHKGKKFYGNKGMPPEERKARISLSNKLKQTRK